MSASQNLPPAAPSLPDDVSQLLPDAPLTPLHELLRDMAKAVLVPFRIAVLHAEALPLGVRLHLGSRTPAGRTRYGQLLLICNPRQQWTGTTPEGRATPLARQAARLLVPSGIVPMVPLW